MKSKYLKIAMISEASGKLRPGLENIHYKKSEGIERAESTDSFRATRITQKKEEMKFPNLDGFIPEQKSTRQHSIEMLLEIVSMAKVHDKNGYFFFMKEGIFSQKHDLTTKVPIGANDYEIICTVSTAYLYQILDSLKKAGFARVSLHNEESLKPFLVVAENEDVKVEHLIMPLKLK